MTEIMNGKNILSVNLSISPPQIIKSPKKFEESRNGVVGLGILAAMNNENDCCGNSRNSVSPKSTNPVPINGMRPSVEEMELCEEYTCVISHFGDNQIKKTEYFYDDGVNNSSSLVEKRNSVKITADNPHLAVNQMEDFPMADFLSSCFRCKKQLHGLDIFMYRGEKAFCSAECRCKQIARDERKEKRVSGGRKAREYSVSPCSGTMHCFAGIAAA